MPNSDLGFIKKSEAWKLTSNYFPSKVGGRPAWLSQKSFPSINLSCNICHQTCIFLIQLYCPYSEYTHTFHRTIYLFICRNSNCNKTNNYENIKVFRSQLQKENIFYSSIPPDYEITPINLFNLEQLSLTCALCGCFADKKCSKCHLINYCSKSHQILHWKIIHKSICNDQKGILDNYTQKSDILFQEYELIIEENDEYDNNSSNEDDIDTDNIEINKKILESKIKDSLYTEKELEQMCKIREDKFFNKFKRVVEMNPEHVIRYERGGSPLWISDKYTLDYELIPNCKNCGSIRIFEFQIMPHLVKALDLDDMVSSLDWGTISIFTCKNSCPIKDDAYVEEFAYKQDIVNEN